MATLPNQLNFFDYLTLAQQLAVQARAFTVDCSSELQTAVNDAFTKGCVLRIPGGGYLLNNPISYSLTGVIADDYGQHALIEGDGMSNTLLLSRYTGTSPLFSFTGGTSGSGARQGSCRLSHADFC